MTAPFDFAQGDTLINYGNSVLDCRVNLAKSKAFLEGSQSGSEEEFGS